MITVCGGKERDKLGLTYTHYKIDTTSKDLPVEHREPTQYSVMTYTGKQS